jgi:cysteine desulfurase/selenocysteine lyase
MLCAEKGARLRVAPIDDRGDLVLEKFAALLSPRTRIVAVPHVSNSLGSVVPLREVIDLAHAAGAPILVDGAQAVPRLPVDVHALGCDFYAFSGHKLYGPTGIGVLYGRAELLDSMPPWQGGGDMITSVTFEKTLYQEIPHRFEAGTPDIAGAVGLGAAIEYLDGIGMARIEAREASLLEHAVAALAEVPGLRLVGTPRQRCGAVSFVVEGIHPHDLATILDHEGVAIRAGHHCAQPVMERFGVPATARASLGLYNTREDLATLIRGLHRAVEVFR